TTRFVACIDSGEFMFKHILIATDGSEFANKAVDQGFALAEALKARVTVVTVTEPMSTTLGEMEMACSAEQYQQHCADSGMRLLSPIAARAMMDGVVCDT